MILLQGLTDVCRKLIKLFVGDLELGPGFQAVAVRTRYHVHMRMKNDLPSGSPLVDYDVKTLRAQRPLDCPTETLNCTENMGQLFDRHFNHTFAVLFRNHQQVTAADRLDVEKRDHLIVLINFSSRNFAGGDFAKKTVVHIDFDYSISELSVARRAPNMIINVTMTATAVNARRSANAAK